MATTNRPGVFHLPRPSFNERRQMQSQPAAPQEGQNPFAQFESFFQQNYPQLWAKIAPIFQQHIPSMGAGADGISHIQPVGGPIPTPQMANPQAQGPTTQNAQGQPNMNLQEPIIGVGERSGNTYFRAGEVPEKITFTPTSPGTPPVPSPGQQPGTFNEFGQYRAPQSPIQQNTNPLPTPGQGQAQAFAGGGSVDINNAGTGGGGSPADLQNALATYLQTNPQINPQDAQDLSKAVESLNSEVGLGKMTPEEATAAFQHFTSSFTPQAPAQPPMQAPSPGADPGAGSYPPDDNSTNFGIPWSQQPGAADNTPGHLTNQGGLTASVVPGFNPNYETRADAGNADAANAATIQQMEAMPYPPKVGQQPAPVAPGAPQNAAPPTATAAPPSAPPPSPMTLTPVSAPPPAPPYGDLTTAAMKAPPRPGQQSLAYELSSNPRPGMPAVPTFSESPRYGMPADKGPAHPTPGASTPPTTGAANVPADFSNPAFAKIPPPDAQGFTHIPDYVHGGIGNFDQNTVNAILANIPPEFQTQAFHIASAESKGNNSAVGGAGEVGIFQIHPSNWPGLQAKLGIPINAQTLKDPATNAKAAAAILQGDGGTWSDWTTAKTVLPLLGARSAQQSVAANPVPGF